MNHRKPKYAIISYWFSRLFMGNEYSFSMLFDARDENIHGKYLVQVTFWRLKELADVS